MTKADFGVLYGQKTTEDALLIYSSYEDAKASPQTGDFIVLTQKDESNTKYLARVEAEIYDEDPIFKSQDKTLIAVHYARIAERELSERDKQKMFSYTYKVRILGTFTDNGNTINFTTAVRKLPTVSYMARHLNKREITTILNKANENGVEIGYLCVGENILQDKGPILFDINKLRNRRTMVFAQSGFGKTNLVKVILYHMTRDRSYGKLIFDLNGEYFLRGTSTYGLGDINDSCIRDNVVVYTDKKLPDAYKQRFIFGGKVALNMHKNLSVGDILNFGAGFSEVMKSFLLYLDEDGVSNFVANIDEYVRNPSYLYRDYSDFFGDQKTDKSGNIKEDVSARKTIMAIRKRIRHVIDEGNLHSKSSNLMDDVFCYLKQGKTVIIDLSLKDNMDAGIISTILVRRLFENNKEKFTSDNSDEVIKTVIFVEEAQNVLSEEFVKSNANPFVRVAKEGRKFGLGLVAITQRPSAISEEIRTQAENFFALHMGNSDDIKALVKSNINYDGVIASFIQRETIAGNLYMVSSDQAFALPVRVTEFEKLVGSKVYQESKFS
ncbi:ATP-binding protein [Cronbergia sp. UHCC 0137]|uniref:ATP-binding protein n=1 Tax=Cronbergia sp. UHCC 0137 TaxID=3110239 RepID=UPI002B20A349|nr:ATP-binding protein [Cronbergia sp. UHCC 0137]MEA5619992.1 ATP-binding protein [Cronbergia sp. UHCC 0137]